MKRGIRRSMAAALLLGACFPAAAQLPGRADPDPFLVAETDLQVAMRDGTSIRVDLYRPARPGRYPALYLAGPFPHDEGRQPPSNALSGPVQWYVDQGYAVVLASTRGTGGSSGDFAFHSRDEQQDHYELIEWIASQAWSDQKVAGAGAGYYAASQWLAALQRPPHLECIAPYNGAPDPYRGLAFEGGLPSASFAAWYEREVRQANAFAAEPRLVAYDLRFQQLAHPLLEDYWRLRSALESASQVAVPVFMMASWNGSEGLAAGLRLRERLDSLNKLLLLDDDGSLYASADFHAREILPFYEWCLKGEGDGFIIQPEIRYQPVGHERISRDATWPPGNADFRSLHLLAPPLGDTNTQGGLDFSMPADNRSAPRSSSLNGGALRFASPVLQRDLEIAGPLMMELYIAGTGTDAAFEVSVFEEQVQRRIGAGADVLPTFLDPASEPGALLSASVLREVSRGRLKASLRALDEERSMPYRPFHSFAAPQPLEPGRVYRLDIALAPIAWRFRQGNRLIVEIRSVRDNSLLRTGGEVTLHHSTSFPSRLWIPQLRSLGAPVDPFAPPAPSARGAVTIEESARGPGQEGLPSSAGDLFDSDNPVIFVR